MQPLHFTIYDSQLRKTLKKFCTQPQQRGTWTQPFHCDLQRLSCKTQKNAYAQRLHKLQNRISTPKRKNDDFEAPKENHQHQNGQNLLQSTIHICHATTTIRFTTSTCKRKSESQDSTGEQVLFGKPWRSHSTAICTD